MVRASDPSGNFQKALGASLQGQIDLKKQIESKAANFDKTTSCGFMLAAGLTGILAPITKAMNAVEIGKQKITGKKLLKKDWPASSSAWYSFASSLFDLIFDGFTSYMICSPQNCLEVEYDDKELADGGDGKGTNWQKGIQWSFLAGNIANSIGNAFLLYNGCDGTTQNLMQWTNGSHRAWSGVTLGFELAGAAARITAQLSHARRYIGSRRPKTISDAIFLDEKEQRKRVYKEKEDEDRIVNESEDDERIVKKQAYKDRAWDALAKEFELMGLSAAVGMVGAFSDFHANMKGAEGEYNGGYLCAKKWLDIANNQIRLFARNLGLWACGQMNLLWTFKGDAYYDFTTSMLEAGRYRVARGKWQSPRHEEMASKILTATGIDLDRFADSLLVA